MSDLMIVERKLNKKKVIIAICIVLIIIASIIYLVHKQKENKQDQAMDQQIASENIMENTIENEQIQNIEEANLEPEVKKPIPNYTQEAKDNIKNIYKLEGHTAYLTFDDGPSNSVTPLILDLLKEKNIKASFFLLGSRVELYPDIVKREYEEGHYLANHGYSHVYSSIYSSVESIQDEYTRTENAIQQAIGNEEYKCHLFRFPGGSVGGPYASIKSQAIPILEEQEISYVDWNALTNDSAGSKTKEKIIQNLVSTVGEKKNVVILMHDAGDKILTYETLPEIIDFLIEKGYTFDNFYNIMK